MEEALQMKPQEVIEYLQGLADDFEMQQRKVEANYLREAAALITERRMTDLSKAEMLTGEKLYKLMTGQWVANEAQEF
jgi:hypothetical protein